MHQWEGPAVLEMNHLLCLIYTACEVAEYCCKSNPRYHARAVGTKIHLGRLKQPLLPTELSFLCQRANCSQVSNLCPRGAKALATVSILKKDFRSASGAVKTAHKQAASAKSTGSIASGSSVQPDLP